MATHSEQTTATIRDALSAHEGHSDSSIEITGSRPVKRLKTATSQARKPSKKPRKAPNLAAPAINKHIRKENLASEIEKHRSSVFRGNGETPASPAVLSSSHVRATVEKRLSSVFDDFSTKIPKSSNHPHVLALKSKLLAATDEMYDFLVEKDNRISELQKTKEVAERRAEKVMPFGDAAKQASLLERQATALVEANRARRRAEKEIEKQKKQIAALRKELRAAKKAEGDHEFKDT